MELEAAKQAALYAPHTLPTESGAAALEQAKKTLGKAAGGVVNLDEIVQRALQKKAKGGIVKMARAGLVGEGVEWLTKSLRAAKAAEAGEELAKLRPRDIADITLKKEKPVPAPVPRAKAKSKEEIHQIAERVAPQITGEFVRKVGKTENVAGKSRKQWDLEKELQHDITRSREVPEAKTVSLEPHKGSVMLSLPGDTSISDFDIHSIGGVGLREPSRQYGGPRFGLGHPEEAGWASGLVPAGGFQRRVTQASKQYGDVPVLANYMAMGPEGMNYALHYSDALLKSIDPAKMTARDIDHTNRIIRAGNPAAKIPEAPDFPGIEHPDAAYLYLADNPATRKHFNSVMQLTNTTEALGLPSGLNVRHAITEPDLRDLERGMTGYSLLQMEPGVTTLKPSAHPTYSHDIPGKFLGRTEVQTPYELTFPDTVAQIRANPKQAGSEFGTLQMGGGRQIIDQQLLDEIAQYRERIKQLTGKKEGGMAVGGVPEKRDVSQLFPLKVPADNAELKPEPKYPLLEKASQGVQSLHDFVSAPFGYENPVGEMASSFLGVPAVAKTLGNIAYDMPLTSGSGMTTNLRPETAEAVMAVAPLVGPVVKTGAKVGKAIAPTAAEMALDIAEKAGTPVRQFVVPPSDVKPGKVKAPADKLGFYSNVEKAALNLQRKSGTGDVMLADMMKNPGVSEARLEDMGMTSLRGKKNVTADEVRELAAENRIPLEESVRVEARYSKIDELESEYEDLVRELHDLQGSGNSRAISRVEAELEKNVLEQKYLKTENHAEFGPETRPEYNTPGGKNYREIRIKLPETEGSPAFTESLHHGDEKNVLLHLRLADHVDTEGKKGLLIDELQSDWHQQGREKGYKGNAGKEWDEYFGGLQNRFIDAVKKDFIESGVNPDRAQVLAMNMYARTFDKEGSRGIAKYLGEEDRSLEMTNKYKQEMNALPDAPFKDNWYQLGLKRAIKEAADTGKDRVYLTTGATQADRYDLSKQVKYVEIAPQSNGRYSINALDKSSEPIRDMSNKTYTAEELPSVIGKELSEKALNNIKDTGKAAEFRGLDLKIGGEGMKQYYDKTYINWLKKYAKEHNSEVGMTKLAGSDDPVYYLDLNPKLKETAKKGQSYAEGGAVNLDDIVAKAFMRSQPTNLDEIVSQAFTKKFAEGGAAYNTTPDMADGGQFIQGEAF
jgi:hypothetical protein